MLPERQLRRSSSLLLLVLLLLGCSALARGGDSGRQTIVITIYYLKTEVFRLVTELEAALAPLAAQGKAEAESLRKGLSGLRNHMGQLERAFNSFKAHPLSVSDRAAISAYNAACKAISSELSGLMSRAHSLLHKQGRQLPSIMSQQAAKLAAESQFQPRRVASADEPGKSVLVTHCNQFVNAFAGAVFGYHGFDNLLANQMVTRLRNHPNWTAIHDPTSEDGAISRMSDLGSKMAEAQRLANAGALVVIAVEGDPHGHVAVVVPGEMQHSNAWGMMLPQIAQAGYLRSEESPGHNAGVFAQRKLSYGFGSRLKNKIMVYVYNP
jgi:hypothetical protein